jgi:hypothetical protein
MLGWVRGPKPRTGDRGPGARADRGLTIVLMGRGTVRRLRPPRPGTDHRVIAAQAARRDSYATPRSRAVTRSEITIAGVGTRRFKSSRPDQSYLTNVAGVSPRIRAARRPRSDATSASSGLSVAARARSVRSSRRSRTAIASSRRSPTWLAGTGRPLPGRSAADSLERLPGQGRDRPETERYTVPPLSTIGPQRCLDGRVLLGSTPPIAGRVVTIAGATGAETWSDNRPAQVPWLSGAADA